MARAKRGPKERWRAIPGFPMYEISDLGRVRSYKGVNQNAPPRKRPKLLLTRPGDGGYRRVTLQNEYDEKQVIPVHLLVARAFMGPARGRVVRHRDGDPGNPRRSNLEYGTQQENSDDKREHGTILYGEDNYASLISEDEAQEIYDNEEGETQQEIADKFGISRQAVSDIHTGKTWSHVTGHERED
jgi:hypothetical protein